MIDVAIRFDDPSATSDHELERSLLSVMADHRIRATFAIVPHAGEKPLSGETVPHLVKAAREGRIEVAQHGFAHLSRTAADALPPEFAGVDATRQDQDIAAGRSILEAVFGTDVHGFVPPFNTFDRQTAALLEGQGFRYISAGLEHACRETGRLAQVPRTCQVTDLHPAIAEARARPGKGVAIIAVLHHYDLAESGAGGARLTLRQLAELLEWLSHQKDVHVHTLNELTAHRAAGAWQRAVRRGLWLRRRHWRIRSLFPSHCLMLQPLFNYPRLKGK